MNAIILAAGRGSRMGSLTREMPKCLLRFKGVPLLTWQLRALRGAGIKDIAIVTGYCRSALLPQIGELKEFHNQEWMNTNMVASLMSATAWLERGDCIVSYSDIFYESEGLKPLVLSGSHLAISYHKDWYEQWSARFERPLEDAETLSLTAEGFVVDIGRKAKSIEEIHGQYMGLLRFTPHGWALFRQTINGLGTQVINKIDMTSALQGVISAQKGLVSSVEYVGEWWEFDSELDFYAYEAWSSKE